MSRKHSMHGTDEGKHTKFDSGSLNVEAKKKKIVIEK
jgi:hypothetical protein